MPIMSKHSVTVSEHIRHHILTGRLLGTDYESLKRTQWSDRFEKLMRNRLIMGALRYGLNFMHIPSKANYDRIADVRGRLDKYEVTGNMEYLVDGANLLMLEFEEGNHLNKHFAAADDVSHTKELGKNGIRKRTDSGYSQL